MDPQLVDRIYECAFVPDQWPSALGELAAIATARTGFLFVSKGEIHRFVGSTDFGLEAVRPLVESGVVARTERFKRLLAARHPGFLTEAEIYPAGDSVDDLASDFGLDRNIIEVAVRFERPRISADMAA